MPIHAYDPLLADKIFDPETYKEQVHRQQDSMSRRIKAEVYGDSAHQPIYYQDGNIPISLTAFIESETFPDFCREIDTIAEHLSNWLREQAIEVHVRESHQEVSANGQLERFFAHLKSDFYADSRSFLYAEGKKYLEIIAVLLRDESIDLAIRKTVVIHLLSDEGLLACASGCHTRLSSAVTYLERSLNTENRLASWIRDYLFEKADTLTRTQLPDEPKTYVKVLCESLHLNFRLNQIHARNYLLFSAVVEGKLPLDIPKDSFSNAFAKEAGRDLITQYLTRLKKEINIRSLSAYLADKVQALAKEYVARSTENHLEKCNAIGLVLDSLGQDDMFSLQEILIAEGDRVTVKASTHFELTLIERLLEQGWLNSETVLLGSSQAMQYKLFKSCLALTWVRKAGEERKRLVDLAHTTKSLEAAHCFWETFLKFEHFQAKLRFPQRAAQFDRASADRIFSELSTPILKMFLKDMQLKSLRGLDLRTVYWGQIEAEISAEGDDLGRLSKIFQNIDFSYANLEGSLLSILDFSGSKFRQANLKNAIFRGSYLRSVDLSQSDLSHAILQGVDFSKANLEKAVLNYANLEDANLTGAQLKGAHLRHANLKDADLTRANLENTDLRRANLEGAVLVDVIFKNTDLRHAILQGVDLEKVQLQGINLEKAHLQESILVDANLKNAILRNANLKRANLRMANLEGADLSGADLQGAKLQHVNLKGANLKGANLLDANLLGANLRGANLIDANIIRDEKLDSAPKRKINVDTLVDAPVTAKRQYLEVEKSLEEATLIRKNYHYSLQQHDINAIVNLLFSSKPHILFNVLRSSDELALALKRFRTEMSDEEKEQENNRRLLTLIINRGDFHWVTLLIFYDKGTQPVTYYNAYYIDSLGGAMPPDIEQILKERAITRVSQLLINRPQHHDFYNSALWALENAEDINDFLQCMIKEDPDLYVSDVGLQINLLEKWMQGELFKYRRGEEYFNEKRRILSRKLVHNPIRKMWLTSLSQNTNFETGLSLAIQCLSIRQKRETDHCLFSWDDIDQFNLEKNDKRNTDKIIVDSVAFFRHLESLDASKQAQLLQFAETHKIYGLQKDAVQRLIRRQKVAQHFASLKLISGGFMQGIIAKDTLAALLREDANTVAINVGFMAGGSGLASLSELAVSKGERWIAEGKVALGQSLKLSAPFLRRGTSLFIAHDLVQQIKAFQHHDKGAVAGIVGDSLFLGVDLAETGIEIVEIAGLISEISSVTGPIGETIGALVMLGTQIYQATQTVNRLDHWVHLSGLEKFKEGWRAFLGLAPEAYIKNRSDLVQAYYQRLEQKLEFLKNQTSIKYYVFPALEEVSTHCRSVKEKKVCQGYLFPNCDFISEVCDPIFSEIKNNNVSFRRKKNNFKWDRAKPISPVGGELICLPTGDDEALPTEGAYRCDKAIGISDGRHKAGNATLFELGAGNDHAIGFLASPNIFVVNNGFKKFYGGERSDLFILKGNRIEGDLDGGEGVDTATLSGFQSAEAQPIIHLNRGYMVYGNKTLGILNIENLSGRPLQAESVFAACHTQQIDMQGGASIDDRDDIIIPREDSCFYEMTILLKPNITVSNYAIKGNFTYTILPEVGATSVYLPFFDLASRHSFLLNSTFSDLYAITFDNVNLEEDAVVSSKYKVSFRFLSAEIRKLLRVVKAIVIHKVAMQAEISIDYHFKSQTSFDIWQQNGLPRFLNAVQCQAFFPKYAVDFHADSFNVTLSDNAEIQDALLSLIDRVGYSKAIINYRLDITSIAPSKTFFYFKEGVELKLAYNKNSYALYRTHHTVSQLIHRYPAIAHRLNTTFFISALTSDEAITIGHSKHEVIYNDPLRKSYLHGNGGENLFVISFDSLQPNITQLPLSDVTLYHRAYDHHIDTLDLRILARQVKAHFNKTLKVDILVDRSSLVLIPYISKYGVHKETIPIVSIYLKYAIANGWYKKLHVILNVAPMKITDPASNRHLAPIPLKIDSASKVIVLGVDDVEKNTVVIIPKILDHYRFVRDKNHLILTNTLDIALEASKHCSIFLKDFYKEPKLSTLSLEFLNKKIRFADEWTEIHAAVGLDTVNPTRLLRSSRSIHLVSMDLLSSGATSYSIGPLRTMINTMGNSVNWLVNGLFSSAKKKSRLFSSNKPRLGSHVHTDFKFKAERYTEARKPSFSSTQLSTELLTFPSWWTQRLPVELGSGAVTGFSHAVLDRLNESYPLHFTHTLFFRTLLNTIIAYCRYSLLSVERQQELEGTPSHRVSYEQYFFSQLLSVTTLLEGLLMGLEYTHRPWLNQAKKCIHSLYYTFFLYMLCCFFVEADARETKLETLFNGLCYMGTAIVTRRATRTILSSEFFRGGHENGKDMDFDIRSEIDIVNKPSPTR